MDLPPLGVLMLDAAFHRPVGDVGHPETWPFPVIFATVPGATPRAVVDGLLDRVLAPFVATGADLAARGAVGLLTSCGFLAAVQPEFAARLPVPVVTSALMQVPLVARSLPAGRRVGVISYDAAALTPRHFTAVGADPATPVAGLPANGALHGAIERGLAYDAIAIEAETLAAAAALRRAHPDLGAVVLECTNLPPFAAAMRAALGLPVYDIVTAGCWLYDGLVPHGRAARRQAA